MSAHVTSPTEHCRICAELINSYWKSRGYAVNACVAYVEFRRDRNIPIVVSDLVCGLPQNYRGTIVGARR